MECNYMVLFDTLEYMELYCFHSGDKAIAMLPTIVALQRCCNMMYGTG